MSIIDSTPQKQLNYQTGDGINIQNETISTKINDSDNNAIGILNGGLYASIPYPTGLYPLAYVRTIPVTPNITITAKKGDITLQAQTNEEGIAEINFSAFGVWTISGTILDEEKSVDVAVYDVKQYDVTLYGVNIFGVAWNKNNPSTQLTRLTPENDPNHLATVVINREPQPAVGSGSGSSPFDDYYPWNGIYCCNLSVDGTETAKLGEDGFSFSTAEVMVHIPKFWYKVIETTDVRYWYICNKEYSDFELHPGSNAYVARYFPSTNCDSITGTRPAGSITLSNARTKAKSKGANWQVYDFKTMSAIQLLYLVEFSNWDCQATIGDGISNSSLQPNGGTDTMLYHTGRQAGTATASAVQYRYMENLWCELWTLVDGCTGYNYVAYLCTNPDDYATMNITNYKSTGISVPVRGWIKGLGWSADFPWAFIPNNNTGSNNTYIPDLVWASNGTVVFANGGDYSYGKSDGLFAYAMNNVDGAYVNVGYRLGYSPQEVEP